MPSRWRREHGWRPELPSAALPKLESPGARGHAGHSAADERRRDEMANDATALRGISDLRGFFRTNQTPIYFISPIAFNLLGIDRWVRRFYYVNYFDSFDGGHPCAFVPARTPHAQFGSIQDVCNYLLRHPEVAEFVAARGSSAKAGSHGKALFVFFDEESERCAADVGLDGAL